MKRVLALFLSVTSICYAQLSEQATISVLTCGAYQEEVFSAFGHSAFRIHDPVNNIDIACHYGIFDFNQPHFYLNFAKGYLYYKFGIEDYPRFESRYIYENRFIHEQILNLTEDQKQKLFQYFKWNSLPENQTYTYDYFYNNCSTKIRDVVKAALGDDVNFDESYVTTDYTIRELTDLYLKQQHWGDLGIDIGLGLPMDKKAAPLEYMFLPDYVESGFDHATIKHDGSVAPLVKEKLITYQSRDEEIPKGLPTPLVVFSSLAIVALALSVWDLKRKKLSSWFDAILFTSAGITGLLLCFLWFFTDHHAAAKNFNLLWALPTHIVAVIAFSRQPQWLKTYFLIVTILSVATLLFWPVLPQMLHYALIPLVAMLGIRSGIQFYLRRSRNHSSVD